MYLLHIFILYRVRSCRSAVYGVRQNSVLNSKQVKETINQPLRFGFMLPDELFVVVIYPKYSIRRFPDIVLSNSGELFFKTR
jgi:hypothetical protein